MAQKSDRRTQENIPNKTKWALEDIAGECDEAQVRWRKLMAHAERHTDIVLATNLGHMRDHLATIKEIAADARAGRYQGRRK